MILDSGERRQFYDADGKPLGVRDISEDKGRCDLLPLGVLGDMMEDGILTEIEAYIRDGQEEHIYGVLRLFSGVVFGGIFEMCLEVSKHYSEGATKYQPRNWEKGIPMHCYIDSGVRHYFKWRRGDKDERHDRAFIWNMLGLLWTAENKPELNDLPWKEGNI